MNKAICALVQGHHEYGVPSPEKDYLGRALKELRVYKKTRNQDHLRNAFNYCFLEFVAPSLPDVYWDSTVKSVTRKQRLI